MDNSTSNITKLITIILFTGLGLNLLFIYFAQERVYTYATYKDQDLGVFGILRSLSVALIFLGVIINFADAKAKYLSRFYFMYALILLPITIIYLLTGPGIDNLTALMYNKGIGPWLALGLIFTSFDAYRYRLFQKFLILSVIVISCFVFYNLIDYGLGLYRGQTLAKYRVLATNLVWIAPYVFLTFKGKKSYNFIRYYALFIGIATALITLTRSFLIIYFLVILFDLILSKKKAYYIISIFIFGLIFLYVVFSSEYLSFSFDLLQQRGANDTRSNQLNEFLDQLNVLDLITGKGFDARWIFKGTYYDHLDNQWLFLAWWAGIVPAISYFYLTVVIPLKLFIRKNLDNETRIEAFVLIVWSLGCAGLAIFSTMSVEFYFFIICILQGRLLYKYTQQVESR